MEWLQFDLVIKFHLMCEQSFFHDPAQYQKITQCIVDVTSQTTDSKEILDRVSPLFDGDVELRNTFIRLFPDLSPPPWYELFYFHVVVVVVVVVTVEFAI